MVVFASFIPVGYNFFSRPSHGCKTVPAAASSPPPPLRDLARSPSVLLPSGNSIRASEPISTPSSNGAMLILHIILKMLFPDLLSTCHTSEMISLVFRGTVSDYR